MIKDLFLIFVLIGMLCGIAYAQMTAIDVNRIQVQTQVTKTQVLTINEICSKSTYLDAAAERADNDCTQAQYAQTVYIKNNPVQQNSIISQPSLNIGS